MAKKSQRSKSSRTRDDKDNQDNPSLLPGWPGYRTRDGRSGYDPIDTRTEAAHTAGTIVQRLFTGEVRHPVYLFLLGLAGLILITPLIPCHFRNVEWKPAVLECMGIHFDYRHWRTDHTHQLHQKPDQDGYSERTSVSADQITAGG
jgi:hypothetical protein